MSTIFRHEPVMNLWFGLLHEFDNRVYFECTEHTREHAILNHILVTTTKIASYTKCNGVLPVYSLSTSTASIRTC